NAKTALPDLGEDPTSSSSSTSSSLQQKFLTEATSLLGIPLPARTNENTDFSRSDTSLLLEFAKMLGTNENTDSTRNDAARNDPSQILPPVRSVLDELDDHSRGRSASTRDLGDFDPARVVKERALSWGQNAINSSLNASAESLVSGLGEHARARMNFHFDRDGKLRGEGDVLLPLYDTPRTVVFSHSSM
ncbi:MAG: inverse autotransporter beta domain-containing protein, partial [Candidatus Accumulibacter sp.]|nr:inverse autotransporter beta domain-containing protein [Accumulibacter sp.]